MTTSWQTLKTGCLIDEAFQIMQNEWALLNMNGIVPQKPFNVEKAQAKLDAYFARRDALRAIAP